MAGRRVEGILVALLLMGCVGAIAFVFGVMSGPGGGFANHQTRELPALEPLPSDEFDRPADLRGRTPESEPETPPEAPGEPEPEPEPEPPEGRSGPATLVLELLAPSAEEERVITAVVKDEQGVSLAGALVVFRLEGSVLYRERTGDEGEAYFVPYDFERGPFRVDALAEGYVPASSPAVKPGATTELVLRPRPFIEGLVKAPSQGVGVVKLFTDDGGVETKKIENDGTFFFDDLEEGYVTVQAEVPPYGSASQSFLIEAGQHQYVRLRVKKYERVRIYGEIGFWPGKGRAEINGIPVFVQPNGMYEYEDAVLGLNEIVIDAPGKALFRERFSVKGRQKEKYDFRLRRGAKVRGRVRSMRTGRPVAGAEVRLGVSFGDPRNDRVPLFPVAKVPLARTGPDGRFEIKRLDNRLLYLVSAVAPGYGQALTDALPGGGFLAIELPQGPFLFGKLSGYGGVPRDAAVSAVRLEEPPRGLQFNVPSYDGSSSGRDREGFYGLSGLLPGLYLVRVSASEYGTIETVIDFTEGQRQRIDLRMRRGLDIEEADAELLRRLPPVVYTELEDLPMDELTILRIDARRPMHEASFDGVKVQFFEEDEEIAPPMLFDDSEFDLIGLPEGVYRAVLTHESLKKAIVRDRIQLQRGVPTTIVLR